MPQKEDIGATQYYLFKIDQLEATIRSKQRDLQRLEAQRNELNAKGIEFLR